MHGHFNGGSGIEVMVFIGMQVVKLVKCGSLFFIPVDLCINKLVIEMYPAYRVRPAGRAKPARAPAARARESIFSCAAATCSKPVNNTGSKITSS